MKRSVSAKTPGEIAHLRKKGLRYGSFAAKDALRRFRNIESALRSRRKKIEKCTALQNELQKCKTEMVQLRLTNESLQKQNNRVRDFAIEHAGIVVAEELCQPVTTDTWLREWIFE